MSRGDPWDGIAERGAPGTHLRLRLSLRTVLPSRSGWGRKDGEPAPVPRLRLLRSAAAAPVMSRSMCSVTAGQAMAGIRGRHLPRGRPARDRGLREGLPESLSLRQAHTHQAAQRTDGAARAPRPSRGPLRCCVTGGGPRRADRVPRVPRRQSRWKPNWLGRGRPEPGRCPSRT